ncbi:MAG: tetratricopeptide repeat protein, partial [Nitrospirota bacterium]
SPGDLAAERTLFRDAIKQLNAGFADGANVQFEALGWEDTLASTGRRNQSVINEEIDRCDVFILALNRRWGQEAPDAKPYNSYTEEEFHRALERWRKNNSPEIFVFFKRVDAASEADPGPQLSKVLEFRRQLEQTRQVLYHYFNSDQSFINEIDRHLRAYAKDQLPKADKVQDAIVLPLLAMAEVKKAKEEVNQQIKEAELAKLKVEEAHLKVAAMQLQTAEDAAKLAKEGMIEFARQKFSGLVSESSNIRILYLGYEFFLRTGDLDSAFEVLKKQLTLNGTDKESANISAPYGNLGILYQTRGDLGRAEEMYRKALAIDAALGCKEGMARAYGNLGNLYRTRGELDRAEEMHRKQKEFSN